MKCKRHWYYMTTQNLICGEIGTLFTTKEMRKYELFPFDDFQDLNDWKKKFVRVLVDENDIDVIFGVRYNRNFRRYIVRGIR